jgi:hypothetical protein
MLQGPWLCAVLARECDVRLEHAPAPLHSQPVDHGGGDLVGQPGGHANKQGSNASMLQHGVCSAQKEGDTGH